jgi:hypothetical protein
MGKNTEKNNRIRFRQPMTKTETEKLIRCISAGFVPTQKQWITILTTLHVRIALQCVEIVQELDPICLLGVIRRQHRQLFQEVVQKIPEIPPNTINVLMTIHPFYLFTCLNNGLDPNQLMSNNQTPLIFACRNFRLQHIQVLLCRSGTLVSENMCLFILRQKRLRRFARQAVKLCNDDVTPNMIVEILQANVSAALICVMGKLEKKYKGLAVWTDICFMLRCPISLEYSTDLVLTPSSHYFDRECLLIWVRAHTNNPLTREKLYEADLIKRNQFLPRFVEEITQKIQLLM